MTWTRTSLCWIFWSSLRSASTEPCTSPFKTMFRSWISPASRSPWNDLERDAAARALGELLAPEPFGADVREVLCLPLVLDDPDELAGGRRVVEAEDLDRVARLRLLDLLPAVVVERSNLARGIARDGRVTHVQCAAIDEHRRDGASPDVES